MSHPLKPPPYVDAVAYLADGVDLARRFCDSGEQYLARLKELPRPAVKLKSFYKTIDQSVVQVVKEVRRGGCRHCGADGCTTMPASSMGELLDKLLARVVDGDPETAESSAQIEAEPAAVATGPDDLIGYLCCVVIGGHGHAGLHGEKPGECYPVGPTGLVLMAPPGNDAPDGTGNFGQLLTANLRLVGLCLVKKVMVLVRDD